MLGMLFPAICENARFDNLFDNQGGLTKIHCVNMSSTGTDRGILTPSDPSGRNSLARFTRPYAPRPISPSTKNSEMFRPPRKPWCSDEGDGARVLALLRMLPELGVRRRFSESIGGGEGGSMGAIDTRPAMRETRCWEDLLRGRGEDGERAKV